MSYRPGAMLNVDLVGQTAGSAWAPGDGENTLSILNLEPGRRE